jgi:alpha-glucosidase (family GH31 glycosyl hydrolase)
MWFRNCDAIKSFVNLLLGQCGIKIPKKMKIKLTLVLFAFLIIACTSTVLKKPFFEEYNGIVSIEAESYSSNNGWINRSYYTGKGLNPDLKVNDKERYLEYQFFINKSGDYHFYVLASKTSIKDTVNNTFLVGLWQNDSLIQQQIAGIPDVSAPVWSSINLSDSNNDIILNFPKAGQYTLRLSEIEGSKYYLDKFVLSNNSDYKPSGTGPQETTNPLSEVNYRDSIILPPQWVFGVLYGGYTNQKQSFQAIDSIINAGFPIDAYSLDSYFWDFNKGAGPKGYIDFIGDTVAYPDIGKLWSYMESNNIKAGIWMWNLIQKPGNEEVFEDFESKGYFSNTYINTNGWHNSLKNTLTGSIDFSNQEAVDYWKFKMSPFFEKGLDFLKLDNSSEIPFCKAAFNATQEFGKETDGRGFILAHLHTTYDNRHKLYPTKWTGDAKITWSQPNYPDNSVYAMGGLKENISMVSDPKKSTYETPFLAHDAGGYNFFGEKIISEELYTRWMQFASMNSVMMIFSMADNPTRNHPYRFSEKVQENFRKYTHIRLQLFPYIYSYAINTRLTGKKMVHGDGIHEEQYLFGNELLVAPVFVKGQTTRKVYFPEGEWIDWENNKRYKGNDYHTVDAPLEKLPLFVKAGSIVPLRKYARAVELGTNDTLILKIYPSEKPSEFTLYEDDGTSNDYLKGIISSSRFSMETLSTNLKFVIHKTEGEFKGMSNGRHYQLKFYTDRQPSEIEINGNNINIKGDSYGSTPNWVFNKETGVLNIELYAEKSVSTEVLLSF